jgi:hypothetical protein
MKLARDSITFALSLTFLSLARLVGCDANPNGPSAPSGPKVATGTTQAPAAQTVGPALSKPARTGSPPPLGP